MRKLFATLATMLALTTSSMAGTSYPLSPSDKIPDTGNIQFFCMSPTELETALDRMTEAITLYRNTGLYPDGCIILPTTMNVAGTAEYRFRSDEDYLYIVISFQIDGEDDSVYWTYMPIQDDAA